MARKKITVHRKGYTRSDGTYVKPSTYTRYVETNGGVKEVGMRSPMGEYDVSLPDIKRHKILKSLLRKAKKEGMPPYQAESSVLRRLEAYEEKHPSYAKVIRWDILYFHNNVIRRGGPLRQTIIGKRTNRGIDQDGTLKAKKPGKRKSKTGKIYYERRVNRSDRTPNRKKGERL